MDRFRNFFAKKKNLAPHSLLQTVRYFRALGFFEEYNGYSNEELAAHLKDWHEKVWGANFPLTDPLIELDLLRHDHLRIWWNDTEADVCDVNKVYSRTLQEWSLISRESFLPENIIETWKSEMGPIEITFDLNGHSVKLRPRYLDDYIDVGILQPVNQAIKQSGLQFTVHKVFDQTAFILVLTADEKRKLQKERGWRFAN